MSANDILAELPKLNATELRLVHERVLELEAHREIEPSGELDIAIAQGLRSLEKESLRPLDGVEHSPGGWQIVLTAEAERDLADLANAIGHDSTTSENPATILAARAESLRDSPWAGIRVRGWQDVRTFHRQSYDIVYRCDEEARSIKVLRFWHSGT